MDFKKYLLKALEFLKFFFWEVMVYPPWNFYEFMCDVVNFVILNTSTITIIKIVLLLTIINILNSYLIDALPLEYLP